MTDNLGRYTLAGRFADVTLVRASKEGYEEATVTVPRANANRSVDFILEDR